MNSKDLSSLWIGRDDSIEGEDSKRWHQIIRFGTPAEDSIAIIGMPCDVGVSLNQGRAGAALGPNHIRKILANLPLHRKISLFDLGNISVTDSLVYNQQQLIDQVYHTLKLKAFPIVLGGGHSLAYGSWRGLLKYLQSFDTQPQIGIINFDAHFDLRIANQANSGTPFFQIAQYCKNITVPFNYLCLGINQYGNTRSLFNKARRLNVQYILDKDMNQMDDNFKILKKFIDENDYIYTTFCMDSLPAWQAPGVSAPNCFGVDLNTFEPYLESIACSGKLQLFDVAEVNPKYDIDNITAKTAARIISTICEYKI